MTALSCIQRPNSALSILIAFPPPEIGEKVERRLHCLGLRCAIVATARQIKCEIPFAAVIAWVAEANLDPLRLLRRSLPGVPTILVVDGGSEDLAVAALRMGAKDYLREPLDFDQLEAALKACLGDLSTPASPRLIGSSASMRELREIVPKIARANSNVLITGETGTGKELVAELIHRYSGRAEHSMVSVNCAAIPESLLESELFGFERGAFTGAIATTKGQMEAAHRSTLFLDEIGELSPHAQAKLLRAIERKEIYRVGGRQPLAIDVRIVAATNREIDALAMSDGFRRDLYFRLNIARVHLPPLRERRSDIVELVNHLINDLKPQFEAPAPGVDDETLQALIAYEWPGNVRELRNVLESACVTRPGAMLRYRDLPAWFRDRAGNSPAGTPANEPARILSALEQTHWNRSRAAEQLSWSRSTLYRRMAKYKLAQRVATSP